MDENDERMRAVRLYAVYEAEGRDVLQTMPEVCL